MNPQFPVYVVSRTRWESRWTSRTLDAMGVPHFIVVEKDEVEPYVEACGKDRILVVPDEFHDDYETCDKETGKNQGPGPARNFAWHHAKTVLGAAWHWVMDDNIKFFFRLNRQFKTPVSDGTILRAMEDFCLRHRNVAMAGPNYFLFTPRKSAPKPLTLNTRIYSCNLIRNDVPQRWRGRYNEDTILSLDMLKAGWATVQFNAFLQGKAPTQTLKGGNTDTFYAVEGTTRKSALLVAVHPDVSKVVHRFSRVHHFVNYRPFKKNPLLPIKGIEVPDVNEYGMALRTGVKDDRLRRAFAKTGTTRDNA